MNLYRRFRWLIRRSLSELYALDLRMMASSMKGRCSAGGLVTVSGNVVIHLGRGVSIGRRVRFLGDSGHISIGDESRIGDNVRIEVKGGQVSIGRGCLINDNCVITAWTSVTLCDHTRIAPFCLITDRNHGLNRNALIVEQEGIKEPVVIEEDVWIASSCVVLPGVRIQRGAVVGANSVVNRSVLPATIVAGSPANKIGSRR